MIQMKLPMLDEEGILILNPKGILEFRTKVLHLRSFNEYLIKLRNLPEYKETWENKDFISIHSSLSMLQEQII
jgi:hypothetical protein